MRTKLTLIILTALLLSGTLVAGFAQAAEMQTSVHSQLANQTRYTDSAQVSDPAQLNNFLEKSVVLKVGFPLALARNHQTPIDADRRIRPIIKNQTTYIPARFVAEQFGAEVTWDANYSVAGVTYKGKQMEFDLKAKAVKIDGEVVDTAVEPVIIKYKRVLVPLRLVAENLGKTVLWDPKGFIAISDAEKVNEDVTGELDEKPDKAKDKEVDKEANDLADDEIIEVMVEELNDLFEREPVSDLVKSSAVIAKVTDTAVIYADQSIRKPVGKLAVGDQVEVVQDRNRRLYLVKSTSTGEKGWVSTRHLAIPPDPPTNKALMTEEEIEEYINQKGLSSRTAYLVWVDIDRQLTHVLIGSKGKWKLYRTMTCSTGQNQSPTVRGLFEISDRGSWFYASRFQSGAKNWVRFNGPYLFHSVPMDASRAVKKKDADLLGVRASEGCIRFSVADSSWFYKHIAEGSTVYVN